MPDIIAERSWEMLKTLHRQHEFVVLGGWAAWLIAGKDKSHDIDVLVDFGTLQDLRNEYEVRKNDRLRKYEIHADGFDIDIYVPHYSSTLALPPEFVQQETFTVQGFTVPKPPALLALKLGAWADRATSAKGQKDLRDIAGIMPLVERAEYSGMLQRSPLDSEGETRLLKLYDVADLASRRLDPWARKPRKQEKSKGYEPDL